MKKILLTAATLFLSVLSYAALQSGNNNSVVNITLSEISGGVATVSSSTVNGNQTVTGYQNVTGNVTSGGNVLGSMTDLTSLGRSTGTLASMISVSSSTEKTARDVADAAIGITTGTLDANKVPYTGATGAVNLGANPISASNAYLSGNVTCSSLSVTSGNINTSRNTNMGPITTSSGTIGKLALPLASDKTHGLLILNDDAPGATDKYCYMGTRGGNDQYLFISPGLADTTLIPGSIIFNSDRKSATIGINDTGPDAQFDITSNKDAGGYVVRVSSQNDSTDIFSLTHSGDEIILGSMTVTNIPTLAGGTAVYASASGGLQYTSSTRAVKKNIQPLKISSQRILNLEPVEFDFKADNSHDVGLIADDVEKIDPKLCTYQKGKLSGVRYEKLAVYLLKVIQEQDKRIKALEKKVK